MEVAASFPRHYAAAEKPVIMDFLYGFQVIYCIIYSAFTSESLQTIILTRRKSWKKNTLIPY